MEFKKLMLKDVIKNIFSGGTPRTGNPEYWDGDLLWLSSGETRSRYITTTEKKITKKAVEESSTRLAKENSIVIASAGQGHTRGQTSFLLKPMYINQSVIAIEADPDIVLSKYLFYNISGRYRELRHISDSSSSRGSLTGKILKDLPIDVPPLKIQNNVVNFIDSVDKRIELNKKIIANLEELSQTLFKRWFVDFEFPSKEGNSYKTHRGKMIQSELGEIPEGWSVGKIDQIGTITGGGTPSKKVAEYYTNKGISWITPKDLSIDKSTFIYKGQNDITELGLKKSSAKLLPEHAVLFSSRAPIGYIAIAGQQVTTNQGFKSIVPDKGFGPYYIYFLLKHKLPSIEQAASGSTFKEISGKGLKNIIILLPNENLVRNFNEIVKVYFDEIKNLELESLYLTELRDTLLPKLMSGEIELPDELEVDEHAELLQ